MGSAATPSERFDIHRHALSVERDGALDGLPGQRHGPHLERIAEQEHVGPDRIAEQDPCRGGGVKEMRPVFADGTPDCPLDPLRRQREIRIAGEVSRHHLGGIDGKQGVPLTRRSQDRFRARNDQVAAQDQISLAGGDPYRADVLGTRRNPDMGEHRSALLGQPGHVDHAAPLAFKVRRHAENGRNRDDACAADPVDNRRPTAGQIERGRIGNALKRITQAFEALGFFEHGTMDSHEGRAEPVDAGKILIAAGLVDAAFAPEFGLDRLDRHAVRFHAAITATLADQIVDEDALVRIGIGAALAATALLGGAGLVIDQHRDTGHRPQFALDRVKLFARADGCALREGGNSGIFLRLVGHHRNAFDTLCANLARNVVNLETALMWLATRHRDGVVVEDLVGDVGLGRQGKAQRQNA